MTDDALDHKLVRLVLEHGRELVRELGSRLLRTHVLDDGAHNLRLVEAEGVVGLLVDERRELVVDDVLREVSPSLS